MSTMGSCTHSVHYCLTRMKRFRPYLDHGFLELDNNTAERTMRAVAVGRKNYLFVGSQTGGRAAAIAYTLIETAKLNGVEGRLSTRGRAVASRSMTGRGVIKVPNFLLVPQMQLKKRLDRARDAARAQDALLGAIVAQWLEGRL